MKSFSTTMVMMLTVVIMTGTPGMASADASSISYQGVLRDAAGVAVADNTYAMEFTLWDAESLGSQLWLESHGAVAAKDGAFSVVLGGSTPLGTIFTSHSAVWLQVGVNTGSGLEIYNPRVPLTSAPYAQQANNADTLDGVDSTGFLTSAHNTTATAHANITLDGARITSGKINNLRLNTGPGGGLDADTVDGKQASELDDSLLIASSVSTHNSTPGAHSTIALDGARITTGKIDNARLNMGPGGGINADLLDGVEAATLEESGEITAAVSSHNATSGAHTNLALNANQITSGKLDNTRLNMGEGGGINADFLDGKHASAISTEFTDALGLHDSTADAHANMTIDGPQITSGLIDNARLRMGSGNGLDADTVDGAHASSLSPAGAVVAFAGTVVPNGWLLCDGAAVSRNVYANLFTAIGTAYGAGDGSTTFNLPNLKARVIAGFNAGDADFGAMGQAGGSKTHTLSVAEMPSHTHLQNAHTHAQDAHGHTLPQHSHSFTTGSGNAMWYRTVQTGNATGTNYDHIKGWEGGPYTDRADANYALAGHTHSGTTAAASPSVENTTAANQNATATNQNNGGGNAHNNLQPYLVANYIIKF